MLPTKLLRLIIGNAKRNRRHVALSAFGIVIGIAALVFFLALSLGIRGVVFEIYPLERVEVARPPVSMAAARKIDADVVAKILARPEVTEVVPRMLMNFPALGRVSMQGRRIPFEAGGAADGVDPSFLSDETFAAEFKDWEEDDGERGEQCGPPPKYTCSEPNLYYCDRMDGICRHRVPAVVSRHILEIYNTQFAESHGLPQIGDDLATFIVEHGGIKAYILLGDSVFSLGKRKNDAPTRRVEIMLVGISEKAIDLGFTLPIQYVKRWNAVYAGEQAAKTYSSLVVTVRNADDVATFGEFVSKELGLRLKDSLAERFSMLILIVTSLFLLIALIIVTISAVNITHNLFMQVMERQREIGLMRAIGATRGDISRIILGEAAMIGVISGAIGVVIAWSAALLIDYASANYVGEFAFKPETYFDFQWWIPVAGIGFSVIFCVLGGLLPARRAASMAPARALAAR